MIRPPAAAAKRRQHDRIRPHRCPSTMTERSGLQRHAFTGYHWLLLAFLQALYGALHALDGIGLLGSKIKRDLQDGAQQQLIALTIQLALLEECADDPVAIGSSPG